MFDPDHALDPDAPQIGPDRPDGKHPNFLDRLIVRKADPLAEIEHARSSSTSATPSARRSTRTSSPKAAWPCRREGGVVVYAPNESPFVNHGNAAMVLDLPHNLVRIIQPPVGGCSAARTI